MELNMSKNGMPDIYQLFIVIFFFSWSAILPLHADTLSDAAEALQNGNYIRAHMLYTKQAKSNDPVALFNLGIMAQKGMGVPADPAAARILFEKAARYKLVDAGNVIQQAIKPAAGQRLLVVQTPQEWVLAQNGAYYTLQLASSTNRKLIEKYYTENQLQGRAGYYVTQRQGEEWYALVYGAYPTVGDANAAITSLPKDLRKWSPWVRKLKDIQRLMQP
ncbi:hypothetical protein MNBD_GAMMA24-2009 [hydrothermal vent metagenome]|uniref:SPOR domain-containing protein n=1 Tax=hydrothermal vent metagenome TaxID=652676 RepID=A0A3B1B7H5_9ZZZZ